MNNPKDPWSRTSRLVFVVALLAVFLLATYDIANEYTFLLVNL